ncbi:MAG: twin-arginine translocase TatA/TatE family subunit [Vicinamibacterales bacterium]|jgi:sec-independent protein translocase protein TatA
MQVGMLAFIGPIGLPELVIIMVILIFIFGANRLSGIGKGVGQAIRGFKDEMKTDDKAENAESRSSE